jgi:hypothetical protein
MIKRPKWIHAALPVAIVIGLLATLEAHAHGAGHGHGHGARAPRVHAAQRAFKQPRMPRAAAPARSSGRGARGRSGYAQTHALNTPTHANHTATGASRRSAAASVNPGTTASASPATRGSIYRTRTGIFGTLGSMPLALSPNTYTYGYGSGARPYRAYGYGLGYRNRYYGSRYGYGRSQGYNRAIIARLRAVRASLARIDHDYQGHRIRAMHSISMAVRQLSHRSMVYSGVGFAPGMNAGMGMRRGGAAAGIGAGVRGRQPMSQAQSDARMSRDLRVLQGINLQLGSQAYNTPGHARARGHVQHAIYELGVALAIR